MEITRVCGSDVHTLSSGWGAIEVPLVVGYVPAFLSFLSLGPSSFFYTKRLTCNISHEIAGTAVRVGSAVKDIKVGDRVGVGAMIASCYDCGLCKNDNENYCAKRIDTYGDKYPDGVVSRIAIALHPDVHI